ncbi:MAG: DUF4136 domain-containing protein [Planctomycetales bacterium]|nr:DUF4136 domain-containing protein [Planctomycetales bacterium]
MKAGIFFLILAAVVGVGGCNLEKKAVLPQTLSNVSVRTSYSPAAKFPAGSKYAFVTFASDSEESAEADKINHRIQASLSDALKTKGYKPGQYAEVHFFVAYTIALQHQIDVLVGKSEAHGSEWISAIVVPNDYVSGALLVQVIDAKSMEPVWLGAFNADLSLASVNEQQKQERVKFAVHELLKSFPPK